MRHSLLQCLPMAVLAAIIPSACAEADRPTFESNPLPNSSAFPQPGYAESQHDPGFPVPPASASSVAEQPSFLRVKNDDGWVPAAEAKRLLHVGDSMVPLVGNYLRQIFNKEGRRYEIVSIASSSSLSWAREHHLREAMFRYDPQVVVISLGSNELFDPNPGRCGSAIRQIVNETRDRPCLWIGPPAWKQDTGFLKVLRENTGRCRYFDSTKLELDRMADGRHPSWTGSWKWAVEVWKVLGGTKPVPAGTFELKP